MESQPTRAQCCTIGAQRFSRTGQRIARQRLATQHAHRIADEPAWRGRIAFSHAHHPENGMGRKNRTAAVSAPRTLCTGAAAIRCCTRRTAGYSSAPSGRPFVGCGTNHEKRQLRHVHCLAARRHHASPYRPIAPPANGSRAIGRTEFRAARGQSPAQPITGTAAPVSQRGQPAACAG